MQVRARLNRRRYREVVSCLKQIIADEKAPQQRRLRAVELLLGVFERHDKNELRKGSLRRSEDKRDEDDQASPDTLGGHEESRETVAAFLARVAGSTNEGDE
ncbi:hypothetical protein [Terriglobus sp. TAA 43]|uniref:hypothetical protein n=1 Tax=Terriglobus sp. TAA 43 TaxID=278961 RepID=UPI000646E59E|nr:hypothetical protein [Terriglobus sp. TAA 43]